MRLHEHPDFEQAVLEAALHFSARGLKPAIIEKDYYVTEALRLVAGSAPGHLIFKGGTSLSKGWNLIHRFSEDLDLFLDPTTFTPPLGTNALDRRLKGLRDAVAKHPALTFLPTESKTIGGFGRNDRFSYVQRFGGAGAVANRILLETGTASGREPTASRDISSYLAQFLAETGRTLHASDEQAFTMQLLHFRRTFVEKLFAIHSKVELIKRDGRALGTYARHFYDLYQLSETPEVQQLLASPEYRAIQTDYDAISRTHFPQDYLPPAGMRFAQSDALFPPAQLAATLRREYEAQCRLLCYGPYPSWDAVQGRFLELRDQL